MTRHGWGRHDWWSGWAGAGWGPPGFAAPPFARGPKVRRGDVRMAILSVLAEQSSNGYQVISRITERSRGAWRPSPGSVYPTLQQLEDEGLVRAQTDTGSKLMELTDPGREYVEAHADEIADTWSAFDQSVDTDPTDLKPLVGQVLGAFGQIVFHGSPQQRAEAATILAETRRRLYGLLADGDPE